MPPEPTRPWPLITVLVVAIVLGLAAVPLQVLTLSRVGAASSADVERNRVLVQQVKDLQEAQAGDQTLHRDRNEILHADLCRIVYEVAEQAQIKVQPCADPLDVVPVLTPTPSPS